MTVSCYCYVTVNAKSVSSYCYSQNVIVTDNSVISYVIVNAKSVSNYCYSQNVIVNAIDTEQNLVRRGYSKRIHAHAYTQAPSHSSTWTIHSTI